MDNTNTEIENGLPVTGKKNAGKKLLSALENNPSDQQKPQGKAGPFLKWVGGKRSLMTEIKKRLPVHFNQYWEPFVGGGALFFELQPQLTTAFLSDANPDLITTYKVVKEQPEALIELLKKHQALHSDEYYYALRSQHHLQEAVAIAARMIYLNKTCFNGLWRVNKKGEFNVPIGKYANPAICQPQNLAACSKALQSVTIECKNYAAIQPQPGDFVYLDPPYHPVSGTSFTAYGLNDFFEKDQEALAAFCVSLHQKGVHLMLSNSHTGFIRELYPPSLFTTAIVKAPRMVNSKASGRNAVEEVLITNY